MEKRNALLAMALIFVLCVVAMAVRMPLPRSVTDGAEARSDLSSSDLIAEMEKLRIQGKRFRPRYYKPGDFNPATAKQGIAQRRRNRPRDSFASKK